MIDYGWELDTLVTWEVPLWVSEHLSPPGPRFEAAVDELVGPWTQTVHDFYQLSLPLPIQNQYVTLSKHCC